VNAQQLDMLLSSVLLQLTLILLAARLCGALARRLGQARAVGEIIAGLLLGPSLLGKLAPASFDLVFRSTPSMPMTVISQLGLILLMFQVGMEFDFAHLKERRNRRAVIAISLAGMLVPFALGLGFGVVSAPQLASGIGLTGYALFMGTAWSITALPILGRIMIEFGLTRTQIGAVTIAAAALTDALGWILLAAIASGVAAQFAPRGVALQLGFLLLFAALCWWLVRPALRVLIAKMGRPGDPLPADLLGILLACVFTSAMLTSRLGIFAIFGGFLIGVLLHDRPELVAAWRARVGPLVTVFFLPIFFTYTGLRTDIGQLTGAADWAWCLLLIALAMFAKFGACYLAARLTGSNPGEARVIGIMMNTRALMELIVINLGYDLGVLPRAVFTMLVLMAVVSTLLTAPALRRWLPRIGHRLSTATAEA
jgi:Kef-type K+ transport system membrane component KefB